ncbi:Taurine catabolism dioxygenase protein [Rutstroemia sp. NJR-2017a WRK4]|nr:Taurine catabolism dioxygenase protein [Rutstroemia sp. NJR-2017a WRK4]
MSEEPLFQISLDTIHSGNTCQNFHSSEAYSRELQHFRESLLKSCSQWPPEYNTSASPCPLLVPESHIKHIERLGNALCRSVTSIVERWWTDPIAGFPQRMPVLPHQETILRWIEDEGKEIIPPFSSRRGAWRPDFLFNTETVSQSNTTKSTIETPQICEINARFLFNGFFGTAFTHEAYQKSNLEFLRLKSPVEPSQVALELHQWEIESMGEEMLKALAPLCLNDLRTIYLVHDKRMLGIVLQELESLVEMNVLTTAEAELLRKGIVPTILPGSPELKELIQISHSGSRVKDDYVLKLTSSGKGKGIIFGTDISDDEWMELLGGLSNQFVSGSNYVVQRLITQPKFDVIVSSKDGRPVKQHNSLVGTFMMADGQHLGIACWRTGPERICAISHGGAWMCSLVQDTNYATKSATAKFSRQSTEFSGYGTSSDVPRIIASNLDDAQNIMHVNTIDTALQKHGMMIITLAFPDPDSTYLLKLVQSLQRHHAHGEPLVHSSTRGWFWDVKPTPKSASIGHHARSETMDDFPWHTDCSYAMEPPKFFGLHVLQADRCGGGTLSVLQLDKVLKLVSKEALKTLSEEKFRIEVPPEFANGTKSVIGPVLKLVGGDQVGFQRMKCRYRADIIHPLTEEAESALRELNKALAQARMDKGDLCLNLTPQMLPNGSVLLMNNGTWLHARNEVKDPERHLRRIRWDAREF